MKPRAALVLVLAMLAPVRAGASIDIAFDNCGGPKTKLINCAATLGSDQVYVSFNLPADIESLGGAEAVVDIVGHAPLPEYWQFNGCNASGLLVHNNGVGSPCDEPFVGGANPLVDVEWPLAGDPSQSRLRIWVPTFGDAGGLSADVDYLAFRMQLRRINAATCPGCQATRISLVLRSLTVIDLHCGGGAIERLSIGPTEPGAAPATYAWSTSNASDVDEPQRGLWLDVGAGPRIAGSLAVQFSLDGDAPAALDVHDVSGRRVLHRDLAGAGAARQTIVLGEGALEPGFYFLRLTQGARSVARSGLVLR